MAKSFLTSIDNMSLSDLDGESELIPLLTSEDEELLEKENLPDSIPILPLRNTVLFPGVVIPITASRDKAIELINDANKSDKKIGVVAQIDKNIDDPKPIDLYKIGTVAKILRVLKMPDGNITVIIQGKKRFKIDKFLNKKPYLTASIQNIKEDSKLKKSKEFNLIIESIKDLALKIINENPGIPTEASFAIKNIQGPSFLINFVSSNMNLKVTDKQHILSLSSIEKRAMTCLKFLNVEYKKLELKNDIQSRVKHDIDKQQREYYLHQQMKTIQEELGVVSYDEEIAEMKEKSKIKLWSEDVGIHFNKELSKLQKMNPQVAEYSVQRNYLDLILSLPWLSVTKDIFDFKKAKKILDRDHFGLDKVKKRIIEYLAVLKLRNDMKSPIICLCGPPGVGKTSLGKSIAESLGRSYVRISLGGMRDESEIRGHRKTYIGAMPGRIIQNIKKSKSSNPVFVLDEIDKLTSGSNGDPSSALLEVLDPEQNTSFYDNFLEIEYDLSKVFFIATANNISSIHPALRDRMEIINISGYSTDEKVEIANKHLLKKQLIEHGIKDHKISIYKKTYEKIIDSYTRESGVRGLDKEIASLARYFAKSIAMKEKFITKIKPDNLIKILGPVKINKDTYEKNPLPGVVVGLAWTAVGGDILFIESSISKGSGNLSVTGNLGKVMKESAKISLEFVKANSKKIGLDGFDFNSFNYHIHVPEGATPKDGPSAGITMMTSLISLLKNKSVKQNLSMTGEITLRGKVLPVGGIKEKILAAKRANIKEIILSVDNKKDVDEINSKYLKGLKFHFVNNMFEVLNISI
ncbi:MAG: endopeptidase La [Flavobacteriaceae bacterium]|nr:endopeptidase La [Flavobacteriaceae bacterium]|tara:strand:- start:553 stop:2970 length:2418 start_codon:yes stop_codon:yes gene_type:complete